MSRRLWNIMMATARACGAARAAGLPHTQVEFDSDGRLYIMRGRTRINVDRARKRGQQITTTWENPCT